MKRFLEIASPEQLYRTFFFKKNYRTVRYRYGNKKALSYVLQMRTKVKNSQK